jgi:aerobic C4-dicarboxylate transport protein
LALGPRGAPLRAMTEKIGHAGFNAMGFVMTLAPLGAFGAMAFTVAHYGLGSLRALGWLVGSFYLTSALFVLVGLGLVARLTGFNILRFLAYIKDELLIVIGASSSEAALPRLMEKLERLGCSETIVGLVTPTGYSFNLDGTNIYMSLATMFIAQALGVDLTLMQQATIIGFAMISSKGASGVSGAGFVTLAATLAAVDPRLSPGMALVLGVDKFMSECRALTNVCGNGVATIVVAAWEGELDRKKLDRELSA